MRLMAFILMPISVIFTVYLPSALQFYFLLTGALQYLQSAAFYNPKIRTFLGLGPLERLTFGSSKKDATPTTKMLWESPRTIDTTAQAVGATSSNETMFSAVKSTLQSAREKMNSMADKKDEKLAGQKAREYEERRALEDKERLLARQHEKLRRSKARI